MRRRKGDGKVVKLCEICGKSFKSLICNNRRFCSLECGYKGRHLYRNKKEYKCATCGKTVIRSDCQILGNVFCSRECSAKHQTDKPGNGGRERNPDKRLSLICKHCGKSFERFTCAVVPGRDVFCSQSCSSTYTNKFKRGSRSKLEKWLGPKLKELNAPVLLNNREILNGYELDIYFPTKNLAFELDGPWHKFPISGDDHLAQIQANDRLKEDLCHQLGIELIRIPNDVTFSELFGAIVLEQIIKQLDR